VTDAYGRVGSDVRGWAPFIEARDRPDHVWLERSLYGAYFYQYALVAIFFLN
jgi:hypothetical protein